LLAKNVANDNLNFQSMGHFFVHKKQALVNVVFEMNVESIFLVTSNPMSVQAFQIEAEALGIQIEQVMEQLTNLHKISVSQRGRP
jgi:hypothetical protein